jgi:hypothetical protein
MTLMDLITIWQADFRDTLRRVADAGGCDLIFTSPPYCDARTAGAYGTERDWTEADYRDLGDAVKAALKPGGWAIVNVDAPVREWRKGYSTERGFHAWRLMLDWAERVGLRVPDRLAFGRQGLVGAYVGRFRNDWEPLLWFQRVGAPGYFDKNPLDRPAVENKHKRTSSGRDATGAIVNVRQRGGDAIERGIARRGTFWGYGNTGKGNTGSEVLERTGHPARFPLRLARDVVACFSAPGALVCDPFLGSGTTAVACAQLGRRFVGGDAGRAPDGRPWADVALDCVGRDGQPRPIAVGGGEPEVAADEMIVALDAGAPPA